jgi:hypothetical protein
MLSNATARTHQCTTKVNYGLILFNGLGASFLRGFLHRSRTKKPGGITGPSQETSSNEGAWTFQTRGEAFNENRLIVGSANATKTDALFALV